MIALMRYVTLVSAHSTYLKGSPQDGMVLETHPAVCEEDAHLADTSMLSDVRAA